LTWFLYLPRPSSVFLAAEDPSKRVRSSPSMHDFLFSLPSCPGVIALVFSRWRSGHVSHERGVRDSYSLFPSQKATEALFFSAFMNEPRTPLLRRMDAVAVIRPGISLLFYFQSSRFNRFFLRRIATFRTRPSSLLCRPEPSLLLKPDFCSGF